MACPKALKVTIASFLYLEWHSELTDSLSKSGLVAVHLWLYLLIIIYIYTRPDALGWALTGFPGPLWESSLQQPCLSYFISTLLLTLFTQLRILASSIFLGWAEGPWGTDPFNTLDLCSGTPFLALLGIRLHSLKSKLKTHLFSSAYWSVILPIHHQ